MSQKIDLTQGVIESFHCNHKASHKNHKSYSSTGNFERRSRRTRGPPDKSPSDSEHNRSSTMCSKQVAKVGSALTEKF